MFSILLSVSSYFFFSSFRSDRPSLAFYSWIGSENNWPLFEVTREYGVQVSNFANFRIALSYGRLQHNLTQIDILQSTGYGHPMKPFFIEVLGLGRQFRQINFGAFSAFLADSSPPMLVL